MSAPQLSSILRDQFLHSANYRIGLIHRLVASVADCNNLDSLLSYFLIHIRHPKMKNENNLFCNCGVMIFPSAFLCEVKRLILD